MEKARRKLRIGLLLLVLMAVLMGVLYSVTDIGKQEDISEGTLVHADEGRQEECMYAWGTGDGIG